MIYDSKLRDNCRESKEGKRGKGQMGNKERDKEKSFEPQFIIVRLRSLCNCDRKKSKYAVKL